MKDPIGDFIAQAAMNKDFMDYCHRYEKEIAEVTRKFYSTQLKDVLPKGYEMFGIGMPSVRIQGPIYLAGGTVS